jgi:hypothetical protein
MTFAILKKIIEKHNIQEDVELLSDSGWECSATEMDGVWYNAKLNVIEFTQDGKNVYSNIGVMSYDEPNDRRNSNNPDDWVLLYYHDHCGDGGKTEI